VSSARRVSIGLACLDALDRLIVWLEEIRLRRSLRRLAKAMAAAEAADAAVPHMHCPRGCEHPQPFYDPAGFGPPTFELICGRCWFCEGRRTVMVACTPETCG
jgi:sugar phosphate isomerase/epimerase